MIACAYNTPATLKVCKIWHALIALKWQVVVANSMGFYGEFNIHYLLFLLIFTTQSHRK